MITVMNVNSTSQNIMTTQSTDNSVSNRQFKSENIRFFNSELEIKEDSIHVDDKIWIQNIFVFIQRIKDHVSFIRKELIRTNLLLCLKENAVMWYINLLNDIEKADLRSDLNLWYERLKKWFQENSAVALKKLNNFWYIWQDVWNQVSAEKYIIKIFYHAAACSQNKFSILLTV